MSLNKVQGLGSSEDYASLGFSRVVVCRRSGRPLFGEMPMCLRLDAKGLRFCGEAAAESLCSLSIAVVSSQTGQCAAPMYCNLEF